MKNKTIIRFYRGCFSMGIVISITYNKDRVIFDFGAPFSPITEIYDGIVLPRIKNKVKDALFTGRIPYIDGVFDQQAIDDLPIISYQDSQYNTAVLICHLHLDHMSEIDKIHPNIPIYIGEDGYKLNQILEEIDEIKTRDYTPFKYGDIIKVGDITIETFFNNHPCPGTTSFLIHTPNQNIVYTGDIRFHGCKYQKAWETIDTLAKEKIDLLIIDSTTTSPSEFIYDENIIKKYSLPSREFLEGEIKEADIYDNIYNSLINFDGIGVFNQYPRDVDMLESMHYLADKLQRLTVFEPSYAYILYKLKGIIPNVYFPDTSEYHPYYEILKAHCHIIPLQEIIHNYNKYLLQNSYKNILSLIDFNGIKGKYFHLFGEPLVKESKEWNIMLNFINKLNWEFVSYINLYSFSHAYPNHLIEVIKTINPKTVVAVHTKHPENLNPYHSKQIIPIENQDYILEDGELKK